MSEVKKTILEGVLPAYIGIMIVLYPFSILVSNVIASGSLELVKWDKQIISNQNVLFFANMMLLAGFGGYLSSKVKRKDLKVAILALSWVLVFSVGYITQYSLPFRF